jgi:hypothetical protein
MLPVVLKRGIKAIINPAKKINFEKKGLDYADQVYWWKNDHKHKGFGFVLGTGVSYTSSIHWAAHIALFLLGFDTLLVVGFDCTTGTGAYQGRGIGAVPHFYDPREGETVRYQEKWDSQWRDMIEQYRKEGRRWEIHNLSVGGKAKLFPIEDWRPYHHG